MPDFPHCDIRLTNSGLEPSPQCLQGLPVTVIYFVAQLTPHLVIERLLTLALLSFRLLLKINKKMRKTTMSPVILDWNWRYHRNSWFLIHIDGFPGGSDSKESACNAGELGSIPGLGGSPGEGNGNPLQYSCLENPMDGGAWWATVCRVARSWTQLTDFTFTFMDGWMEKYTSVCVCVCVCECFHICFLAFCPVDLRLTMAYPVHRH